MSEYDDNYDEWVWWWYNEYEKQRWNVKENDVPPSTLGLSKRVEAPIDYMSSKREDLCM